MQVYRDWAEDWSAQAEAILERTAFAEWTVTKSVGTARDVLTEASRPETVTLVRSVGHALAHAAAAGLGLTAVYGWSASHRSGTPLAGRCLPRSPTR
jgi:hypothetical protein